MQEPFWVAVKGILYSVQTYCSCFHVMVGAVLCCVLAAALSVHRCWSFHIGMHRSHWTQARGPVITAFAVPATTATVVDNLLGFREVNPHWDITQIPLHNFKAKDPFPGKVVSVDRLVGPLASSDVYKVVIEHSGQYQHWEGQCCGVIPPGLSLVFNRLLIPHFY
jgi:hypothetical protein